MSAGRASSYGGAGKLSAWLKGGARASQIAVKSGRGSKKLRRQNWQRYGNGVTAKAATAAIEKAAAAAARISGV